MECLTAVLGMVFGSCRVHVHPADGILYRQPVVVSKVMVVLMPGVTLVPVAVMQVSHGVPPLSGALGPWGLALRSLGRTLDPAGAPG
jgi:hypothetical protein